MNVSIIAKISEIPPEIKRIISDYTAVLWGLTIDECCEHRYKPTFYKEVIKSERSKNFMNRANSFRGNVPYILGLSRLTMNIQLAKCTRNMRLYTGFHNYARR